MPIDSLDTVCDVLRVAKSVLICTHVSPDPDAIGSSFALQRGLAQRGVEALVYLPERLPERVNKLVGNVPIVYQPPAQQFSVVAVVDTASQRRIGPAAELISTRGDTLVNIDHHASNEAWGQVNYIEPQAAASAQIILQVLKMLGVTLERQI